MSTAERLPNEYDDYEYERRRAAGGIALEQTLNGRVVRLHRVPNGEGDEIVAVSSARQGEDEPDDIYEVRNLKSGFAAFDTELDGMKPPRPELPYAS